MTAIENKLRAKYTLIAVGNSDVGTEVTSRVLEKDDTFSEIYSRALGINDKDTYLNVMYRGNSNVLTEIQPIGYNTLPTEIEVRPHNRMWALYEVQQPPIVTTLLNPVKDAFTREQSAYETINYGSNSSMVIGRSQDDIWRSFIQFDTSFVNPSYILTESYLRLYYKGVAPENVTFEVLNANSDWQEYNITNLNRPSPIELITNEFTVNKDKGYIEFDVLEVIKSWVALKQINNGFIIRLSNETNYSQTTFHTRESILPPELVVKHYDSRIFSQGRSQQLTEILVCYADDSTNDAEITVSSTFSFSKYDTEIYVHRAEEPLDSELLTEITVTKPNIHTEMVVVIQEDSDINTQVDARVSFENKVITTIFVSRPFAEVELFVRYKDDILTEITPRAIGTSSKDTIIAVSRPNVNTEVNVFYRNDVLTEITLIGVEESITETVISTTRPNIDVELYVPYRNDVLTEIFAIAVGHSNADTEISINKPFINSEITPAFRDEYVIDVSLVANKPSIHTEITVKYQGYSGNEVEIDISDIRSSKVITEISVRQDEDYELDTEISVTKNSIGTEIASRVSRLEDLYTTVTSTRPSVQVEIEVAYRSDVWVEIEPNIKSDTFAKIISNKPAIYAEISVMGYEDSITDTEIFVSYVYDVETEITSLITNELQTEIDIVAVKYLPTEITASKKWIHTQIVIPTWVDHDIPTAIEPRIFMVNNIYTRIQVGSVGGAYAFII